MMRLGIMRTMREDSRGTATGIIRLQACMGVPVEYHPDFLLVSESRGIWPFKKIVVGPMFQFLGAREKGAVVLHEVGHCKLAHTEKLILHTLRRPRLLWAVIAAAYLTSQKFPTHTPEAALWFQVEIERRAPGIAAFRQAQELQADAFAAGCGYGPDLAQALIAMRSVGGGFHPPTAERIRANLT